ncbi:TPA: hypothetical protein ACM4E9_004419 [Escherichia coli]
MNNKNTYLLILRRIKNEGRLEQLIALLEKKCPHEDIKLLNYAAECRRYELIKLREFN